MRKLVKKLALVLALVLAFACFAPASAQAAEVRRSWNFAVGEYKPTLEMEVEENFALELLDYGDTIDASIYDVAYYSKSDALEVNKLTGYAEAKAAENDVPIAAVVTNKVSGDTAKIWAFVDIAAKEVVATPTATATATATPVPTKAPFALESAKQISKTELVLTFNDDASKVTKNDLGIKYATKANAAGKINAFVKSISAKDNTVTVTLYKEMKDDNYMFVTYGNVEKSFQVSVGEVASIEILTTNVKADTENGTEIKVRAYDENGIELFEGKLADLVSANSDASYELTFGDESNIEDDVAFADVADTLVYFFEEGKEAVVELIYYTGNYDEETGEYDKVYASQYISSIDTTPYITNGSFGVGNKKNSEVNKISFGNKKLYIGENNLYVAGKLTISVPQLDGTTKDNTGYAYKGMIDWNGKEYFSNTNVNGKDETVQAITYETCDSSIVLVDPNTGLLTPVSAGSADVIVKFVDTIDDETGDVIEGDIIGICEVVVNKTRVMDEIRVTKTFSRFISTASGAADSDKITFAVEDQYNGGYAWKEIKVVQLNYLDNANYTQFGSSDSAEALWAITGKNKNEVTFYGYANGKAVVDGTYRFKLVAVDEDGNTKESAQFAVKFKQASTKASNYKLEGLASALDVKVQKDIAGVQTIALKAYDASGLRIKTEAIEGLLDKENKLVADGSFWLEVTTPDAMSDADKDAFTANLVQADGTVKFNPFKQNKAGEELESWTLGKYTFTVWKFNATTGKYTKVGSQAVASTTLSNSQQALSVELANYTTTLVYDEVVSGQAVGAVHAVTSGALVDALIKNSSSDTGLLTIKLNGKEYVVANTGKDDTVSLVEIKYVTDGKKYVSIKEVTVVYNYKSKEATLKAAVEGITVEFATE